MSDFERQIREQQNLLRSEEAKRSAWADSPFGPQCPVVGRPTDRLAGLVADVLPRVPRGLWHKGWVGQSPDGLTRVFNGEHLMRRFGEGGATRAQTRQWKLCAKCKIWFVMNRHYSDTGGMFVLLNDGRAGYAGELDDLQKAIVRAIAADVKETESLLTSYRETQWWRGA
jgi:hypothetical protein